MYKNSYLTDHAYSPRPPLPPLFSLTIPEKGKERKQEQARLFSEQKQVHIGMDPQKPTKLDGNDILHRLPFCELCTQNSLHEMHN